MLDSAFYFPQYYTVIAGVFGHNGGPTQPIQDLWNTRSTDWGTLPARGGIEIPPDKFPVNFLDNHDVGRFLFNEYFTS